MFIHGLGGDAFKTWSHSSDHKNSWPYWLGKEFSNVGVWSIGYEASPIALPTVLGWVRRWWPEAGQSMALPHRALQLLDKLQRAGIGQRPLLFICHSLGGLVAKQILRTSRDTLGVKPRNVRFAQVAANTRAVLFLATPHTGAALASKLDAFREQFGTTVNMSDLKAHDAHLRNLFDWYRNHAPAIGIETITYYEGQDVANALRIVNETSSHPGVGADPIMLDKNHISIAKPFDEGEDVYQAACDLIRDHVLSSSSKDVVAIPTEYVASASPQSVVVNLNVDRTLLDGASPNTRHLSGKLSYPVVFRCGRLSHGADSCEASRG